MGDCECRSQVQIWRERLAWTAYAFLPSALLVAVTAHVSTDVAAAPFLWIVPLALFLLTFVIVFQKKPLIGQRTVGKTGTHADCALAFLTLTRMHLPMLLSISFPFRDIFYRGLMRPWRAGGVRPPRRAADRVLFRHVDRRRAWRHFFKLCWRCISFPGLPNIPCC